MCIGSAKHQNATSKKRQRQRQRQRHNDNDTTTQRQRHNDNDNDNDTTTQRQRHNDNDTTTQRCFNSCLAAVLKQVAVDVWLFKSNSAFTILLLQTSLFSTNCFKLFQTQFAISLLSFHSLTFSTSRMQHLSLSLFLSLSLSLSLVPSCILSFSLLFTSTNEQSNFANLKIQQYFSSVKK